MTILMKQNEYNHILNILLRGLCFWNYSMLASITWYYAYIILIQLRIIYKFSSTVLE